LQVKKEVIVDLACGMAVLRGADVFVLGIMGAPACKEFKRYFIKHIDYSSLSELKGAILF